MKAMNSAASAVLAASPSAGLYDAPFAVDIVIDGHRDVFNAAQTKVVPSSNLAIKNLVLGDCGFSFLHIPTVGDPSFAGVLLGTSAKKCTVYTLTLAPTKTGKASLSLTHATVRRYGDAVEILSSIQNGTYDAVVKEQSPLLISTSSAVTAETLPPQSAIQTSQFSQKEILFPVSTILIISAVGGVMTLLFLIFAVLCCAVFRTKNPVLCKHERGSLGSERNSR